MRTRNEIRVVSSNKPDGGIRCKLNRLLISREEAISAFVEAGKKVYDEYAGVVRFYGANGKMYRCDKENNKYELCL